MAHPFNPLRYGGWIGNFLIKSVKTGPGKSGQPVDDLEVSPTHAPDSLPANYKMRFPAGYGGQLEAGDILTISVARKNTRDVCDEPTASAEPPLAEDFVSPEDELSTLDEPPSGPVQQELI